MVSGFIEAKLSDFSSFNMGSSDKFKAHILIDDDFSKLNEEVVGINYGFSKLNEEVVDINYGFIKLNEEVVGIN